MCMDLINLAILHNEEIKFSNFMNFVNSFNQLAIHFAGLVCSGKTKNGKISKFSVLLNLCTLR